MEKVLSPFLYSVDDGFRDFWTNACYLLADSFFQLGDSLRIMFIHIIFPLGNLRGKSLGMKDSVNELDTHHSIPKNWFSMKSIAEK